MGLIYETRMWGGNWIKVFSDRVECKPAWLNGIETIPLDQIASIKVGNWAANRIIIETTGGREYVMLTNKKKEVADELYQAQAAFRSLPRRHHVAVTSVADEMAKLAQLRNQGVLSNEEFELYKTRL